MPAPDRLRAHHPERAVLFIACGIALGLVTRPGSVWVSLVSVVLFCGLWILANYDYLGGGDAKLVAAVTLLVPPDRIGLLLIEIALAGGMVSGAYLAAARIQRRVRNTVPIPAACRSGRRNRLLRSECARITYESSVPYALAVLGGVGFYVVSELSRCLFATFCSL
jgi:prepilin peptidase CpaA